MDPDEIVDVTADAVRAAASELTRESTSAVERARALFHFVRDRILYAFIPPDMEPGQRTPEVFRASRTLARGSGMCIQKAVLLCALARAAGVPARLSFQAIRDFRLPRDLVALMGTDVLTPHGLVSLHLNGRWIRLDPSLDRNLRERKAYRVVEFAEAEDALLSPLDANGRPHFQVIEELGEYDEFPMEMVRAIFEERRQRVNFEAIRRYVEKTGATM